MTDAPWVLTDAALMQRWADLNAAAETMRARAEVLFERMVERQLVERPDHHGIVARTLAARRILAALPPDPDAGAHYAELEHALSDRREQVTA